MGTPLTPEERSVMRVLSAGRPKRNLHVYALLAVGVFFLAMALWKGLSRSSDPASRVSERPGPKAPVQEPSPATLRDLLQKQSTVTPSTRSDAAVEPRKSNLQPPSSMIALDEGPRPAIAMPPPLAERSPELERKLVEAGYMTAKTEVYVQAIAAPTMAAAEPRRESATPNQNPLHGTSASEALTRALESGSLARMPNSAKPTTDERIAMRAREQEGFASKGGHSIREPQQLVRASALVVAEGRSIPAVLRSAIASDLPGPVEAMVVSDVYDSMGRGRVLIPKGSHLIGSYNSAVAVGQERLQILFTRLRLPSGASIALDSAPAGDSLGRSGAPGEVDNHYLQMLGSAIAMGLVTLAVERRIQRDAGSSNGTVNVYGGSSATAGSATAQAFGNVTNHLLERNLGIGPTIKVPAGTRIQVQVVRDLAIPPEAAL